MKLMSFIIAVVFSIGICLGGAPEDSYAKTEKKETASSTVKKTKTSKTVNNETKKKSTSAKSSKPAKKGKNLKAKSVSINSADKTLLTQLPGVGDKTADAIIKHRKKNGKFKSIEDLMQVSGIGEKKLKKMKQYLKL